MNFIYKIFVHHVHAELELQHSGPSTATSYVRFLPES